MSVAICSIHRDPTTTAPAAMLGSFNPIANQNITNIIHFK